MPALYRQYRPVTFAEITGQNHITSVLGQEILKNKIAHAYLFQGPRGTGKTTTARVFAKRLNCLESKTNEPCGTCTSCVAHDRKSSLDMIEIDAASNRGIDDIRALRETTSLAPTNGTYKIYIIDEVHMLSGPAFAALLKTLEEPPKHVVFILATTELHKVPATIASRCQLFRFRRATAEEMKTRLTHLLEQEKRTADDDVISFITRRSDGCYRDAESLLGQLLSHSEDNVTLGEASDLLGVPSPEIIENFLEALVAGNAQKAVALATKAYTDGFDSDQFIQEAVRTARDGIVRNITNTNPPAFASGLNAVDRITVIMRAFLGALQDIAYVPEPMIALELAILTSCVGVKREVPVAQQVVSQQPVAQPAVPVRPVAEQAPVVQQKAVAPKPITPVAVAAPAVAPALTNEDPAAFSKIQSNWEAIIQSLRKANPVASTFLRATTPTRITDGALILKMQFPLHKTFFEKPDNAQLVQSAMKEVMGSSLKIRCELDTSVAPVSREQKESKEEDLLRNVQEVFGVKVS